MSMPSSKHREGAGRRGPPLGVLFWLSRSLRLIAASPAAAACTPLAPILTGTEPGFAQHRDDPRSSGRRRSRDLDVGSASGSTPVTRADRPTPERTRHALRRPRCSRRGRRRRHRGRARGTGIQVDTSRRIDDDLLRDPDRSATGEASACSSGLSYRQVTTRRQRRPSPRPTRPRRPTTTSRT